MTSTDNSARTVDQEQQTEEQFILQDIRVIKDDSDREKYLGGNTATPVLELEYKGLKCAGQRTCKLKNEGEDQARAVENRKALLKKECHILSQVRHPNIVQFLGVYFPEGEVQTEVQTPILVMEFLPTNLTSCIEQHGILPKEISYSILHDVALGLHYLHSQTPPIIHRDLYSNNVLLTPNMTAKISDLNKATILMNGWATTQRTGNPAKISFMPPEAIAANPEYDTCIDEFSYGNIMIHVLSGRWPEPQVESVHTEPDGTMIPISEAKRREVFLQAIGDNHPLMDLIKQCIKNNHRSRAHTSEIVKRLAGMVLQFPASSSNRLEMLRQIELLKQDHSKAVQKITELESKLAQYDDDKNEIAHLSTTKDNSTGQNHNAATAQVKEVGTATSSTDPIDDSQGAEKPDTSKPELSGDNSGSSQQKPTTDHLWCGVVKQPSKTPDATPDTGPQTARGVAVMEALWDKKVLGVKFNPKTKNLLSKWNLSNGNKMTTETIIIWANTWHIRCGSSVPSFVDVDEYPDLTTNEDIKVDFNENGENWSKIGTEATQCSEKFTMQLSLVKATNDSLKKHYIIHEFGHALGLGHEHQRSKFWKTLCPFVYINRMKNDPHIGGSSNFDQQWSKIHETYYTSDLEKSNEYDPESIMHYWFKVEWLNNIPAGGKDYSVWANVKRDFDNKVLDEEDYAVLYGLHKRRLRLSPTPSVRDIAFLKECYESRK